ncbi:SAG-related sequence SRS19F [Toxoplasma gondii ME49]|uniref:SAG-related sequence SRS19F n=4 Tax=Toxoplasma gondii TaxID=5811 RepID=S7VPV0_TOXGG|nr:SAG-related sequence SRS19F [Toxoplasma gondii ME49]EPR57184.1 SAG-related sequence SRS19F [Toxoplasma gondii GT1]EPT31333.1 SAG-related sequence SRS19F [Toxoplasma gondii ME49]KAF4645166.1 SAG-related sequence SRS19F [Toxoplasma gondii]KYF38924.1 SAG-related sequence SRS19F [Toxoplasma gondii ARI]|eukprot:XP_002371640.1 SAG-related sequence SRS19F [Toxoplasma gondii ME49]
MLTAQTTRRVDGRIRPRVTAVMAICMGGVLLFSAGQVVADKFREGLQGRKLQSGSADNAQTGPQINDNTATCVLTSGAAVEAAEQKATALVLSKQGPTAKLVCSGDGNAAAPRNLEKVCEPSESGSGENCKLGEDSESTKANEVTLQTLLRVNNAVQWKKVQPATERVANGEAWTLTLTEADFPLTDTPFFVGCKKSQTRQEKSGTKDSCKVPVHVEARASAEINNIVTCAYGQKSNEKAVQVELTADQRSVTINCGSVGSPMPADPTTQYCEPGDAESGTCKGKNYVDVLPKFEASWVKHDGQTHSVTLTIPEDGFPSKDEKIRLGCVPTKSGKTTYPETSDEFGVTTTNCHVIVTVKATSSASSATSSLPVAAVASGAVVVTGLLAGSL